MKKKFLSVPLIVAIIFVLSPGVKGSNTQISLHNVNAETALNVLEQEYISMYNGLSSELVLAEGLISCYKGDPMFEEHYKNDPEDAMGMVVRVIDSAVAANAANQPQWTDGTIYSADGVPTYKQSQTNSCGAASALQVIVQQGGGDNIAGSTYTAKEQTLINQTGINTNGSVLVYEVRNLINNHIEGKNYAYIPCANLSATNFRVLVLDSLTEDCPIVLHANTKYIGYYNSNAWGHYIVGTTFFAATEEFVVNDCNYMDQYTGIRTTTMTEIYNSVHNLNSDGSSRYLIYGT